jgi:hypothetical protein
MKSLKRCTLDFFKGGLRGFGFGDVYHSRVMVQEGFDRLKQTGANCVRVGFQPVLTKQGYILPQQQVEFLKETVVELQKRRIYCIPVMFTAKEIEHNSIWNTEEIRQSIIDLWLQITRIFRNRTVIAGFDLFNEPTRFAEGNDKTYWNLLIKPLVEAINKVDSKRICIVSTFPHGLTDSKEEWGQLIEYIPNTVLTAHLYSPIHYTHADMAEWSSPGKTWSLDVLADQANSLLKLRQHSLKTGQPIWIGEASTLQDREGASDWALHFTQLMQAYNFSGSWHYYIGWPGWHPNDEALQHLQQWFKGGVKP